MDGSTMFLLRVELLQLIVLLQTWKSSQLVVAAVEEEDGVLLLIVRHILVVELVEVLDVLIKLLFPK